VKDQFYNCVQDLIGMLKTSDEYTQYMAARTKMLQDEGSAKVLRDLRQRQMRLQFMGMMGEDTDEGERELEDIYMALSLNPVIGEFLTAEYRLSKMIRRIYQIFDDALGEESELFLIQRNNELLH